MVLPVTALAPTSTMGGQGGTLTASSSPIERFLECKHSSLLYLITREEDIPLLQQLECVMAY